jgi:UDP-3-O-[3-hydroxymyristoyl] N-acetylglucosamine deacetylase
VRFADEFVRHKTLDAIGDFSLLGHPVLGHVKAYKAGHQINHKMVTQIINSPECWKLMEFTEEDLRMALQDQSSSFIPEPLPAKA